MHQFEATVDQAPGPRPWLFIRIPGPVSDALGSRTRVEVRGRVNEISFQSMLFVSAGDDGHYLMLNQAMKTGTNAGPGSVVRVRLEPA
jgi:hypothetical protein